MRIFEDHSTRLVLKRNQLNYHAVYNLWRTQYLIFVKGEVNGVEYAARCYIQTGKEDVEAIIMGGSLRTCIPNRPLIMDGSLSRDYSKFRNQKQFESYNWNCHSNNDNKNRHCIHNISTGETDKYIIDVYIFILFFHWYSY